MLQTPQHPVPSVASTPAASPRPPIHTLLFLSRELDPVLQGHLGQKCYRTVHSGNGAAALATARQTWPDLVLLDLSLPNLDSPGFLESFRALSDVPVILITTLDRQDAALLGLQQGADDYILHPFAPDALEARVQAALDRYGRKANAAQVYRYGPLEIHVELDLATRLGQTLELTRSEFCLLRHLMREPGRTFSRADLLPCIASRGSSQLRNVDVYIRKLRLKIEEDPDRPQYLKTVFGMGYRLNPDLMP